jgi:hypothetical protein
LDSLVEEALDMIPDKVAELDEILDEPETDFVEQESEDVGPKAEAIEPEIQDEPEEFLS